MPVCLAAPLAAGPVCALPLASAALQNYTHLTLHVSNEEAPSRPCLQLASALSAHQRKRTKSLEVSKLVQEVILVLLDLVW